MKTILVPVDFSDNSRTAMDYAVLLCRKLNMDMVLLHVYHTPLKEVTDELESWLVALKEAEKDIVCSSVFLEGKLTEQILNLMTKTGIDLIVMGTKGASGLKAVLMGSNTMKVIENLNCPVLAVPGDFKINGIRKIVYATDYREGDDISIRSLGMLATSLGSELSVVHVLPGDGKPGDDEYLSENFIKGVAGSLAFDDLKFHCLQGDNVHDVLDAFMEEQGTDLFAISMTDKTFLTTLFKNGLTWKFAYQSKIPLMVFPVMEEEIFKGVVCAF